MIVIMMVMIMIMIMMMMVNNGGDLLPALLWVPAVSPRAVMVTTGLDTLQQCRMYILQTWNIYILLCYCVCFHRNN